MSKPEIYGQHDKAFSDVSAYAVVYDGKPVAKVAFKYARSGLRTTAFVHWIGQPMVRGWAGGGGYDKASAAVASAAARMRTADVGADCKAFIGCAQKDDGQHWDNRLRAAGFDVFQVI